MKTRFRIDRRGFLVAAAGVSATAIVAPWVRRASAAEPFRVGALNPVTGAGGTYGPGMQKMIIAAIDEINAAGGAGGRTLEVVAEDTQTSPDAAILAAKKLIEVNKVQAVLGTWSSGVTLAVMPSTDAANLPLMCCSGAPVISTQDEKDLVWRFQATNTRFGRAFAKIAQREGFKRPATMAFNNASGIGNTEGFKTAWEAMGGKVVAQVVYEPKRASYRSELQKVLAADPDVIVMGSYLPDTTIILREWYQSGAKNGWIIPGWAANSKLVDALGPEVTEGIIAVEMVANEKAPSFEHYDALYKAKTGQSGTTNVYAAMTYDMAICLGLSLEAAGPGADIVTANGKMRAIANPPGTKVYTFAEAIKAMKSGPIDYQGASSRLDFDEYGDVTPDFGMYVIEKGKLVRRAVIEI